MNERFEELYELMKDVIHAAIGKHGGLLKMDRKDLEQELLILLFELAEKHGHEEMKNRRAYFYKSCVYTIHNLSLQEHKQGLFLECSNIMISNDEFDMWDTYVDDGIDYEMKDEFLERYYEKKRQREKERYWNNREEILEKRKKYREAHLEKMLERERTYHEAHREQENERQRKYYEAHREQELARCKKYRETHKEEILERGRKYRAAHRKEILEYQRKYRQKKKQQKLEEAA